MTSALAGVLGQLADVSEIRGRSLDAAALRQLASEAASRSADDPELTRAIADGRLPDGHALDPALIRTLRHLRTDGHVSVVQRAAAALPWLLRELIDRHSIDTAAAALLARHGIVMLPDLETAIEDGRVTTHLEPFADRLRIAASALAYDQVRVPLGRAVDLLDNFCTLVSSACPELESVVPAGDARRFEPMVSTLVVVATAADPPSALDRICAGAQIQSVSHRTARRAIVMHQQTEVDLRVAAPDEHGTTLYVATGAPAHLAAMRRRTSAVRICAREENVYSQAGLPWIAPELRHGTGEVEAAASNTLPPLVERAYIRGDLHMHTTASDGRDSLIEMVQTCAVLGYEYIAITDHSERSAAMRTLTPDALLRQRDEIARIQERFPGMTILHGVEVDIMPDGSLDFPDRLLEPLDIVLASLHDRAGQEPAELTRRCLAAIAHPLVNVITHPANQLVGQHAGYALDFDAIYAAAVESGTALEVDGAPSHLDMDGERARGAVAAGCTITIDSDCHRARLLDKQMTLGIGTARRGWVGPSSVLNTRPVTDVRAFVAAKRRART